MAKFARYTGRTSDELMVHHQACSDSFRDRQRDEILCAFGSPSEPNLRQGTCVCSVLEFYGKTRCFFQRSLQIKVAPVEIWRKHQTLRSKIHATRQADTDTLTSQFWPHFLKILQPGNQV